VVNVDHSSRQSRAGRAREYLHIAREYDKVDVVSFYDFQEASFNITGISVGDCDVVKINTKTFGHFSAGLVITHYRHHLDR
jgi:hypothetical protein